MPCCALKNLLLFPVGLIVVVLVAACSDLRVNHRVADASAADRLAPVYAFERPPLSTVADAAEDSVYVDGLMRKSITTALAQQGYRSAGGASYLVDFAISETEGVMAPAMLTPGDYSGSWRARPPMSGAPDPANPMDHRVASSDFNAYLQVMVLMRDAASGKIVWEGAASQTLPERRPRRFEAIVGSMVSDVVKGFPQP